MIAETKIISSTLKANPCICGNSNLKIDSEEVKRDDNYRYLIKCSCCGLQMFGKEYNPYIITDSDYKNMQDDLLRKWNKVMDIKETHIKNLNDFLSKASKIESEEDKEKTIRKREILKILNGCSYNFSKSILEEVIKELGDMAYLDEDFDVEEKE